MKFNSHAVLPHLLTYAETTDASRLLACESPDDFDSFEADAVQASDEPGFALSKLLRLLKPTQRRWVVDVTRRRHPSPGTPATSQTALNAV